MMGWEKQHQDEAEVNHNHNHNQNVGIPYVKVMTDDQLETLRKQISVYATICEQLVEMHKNLTSHPDLPGVRLGHLYCDPMMTSAGAKITARQRWTPTPVQLQMLERIFEQGNGTPSKQKIKDMTAELGHHGQISETNVYNWFQNRRARSKRKQQTTTTTTAAGGLAGAAQSNADSEEAEAEAEAETEPDSPKDNKAGPAQFRNSDVGFHHHHQHHHGGPEITPPPLHFFDDPHKGGHPLPAVRTFPQMPFYDGLLSNPRSEHLGGKMEVGGPYGLYDHSEDYGMS